jgi:TPR repeat protein
MKGQVPEAIKWYQKAALKGDANAITFLKERGIAY